MDIEQLRNFRAGETPYPVVERALRERLVSLVNEKTHSRELVVGAIVLHGSFGACRVVANGGDGSLTIIHGDCVFNVRESDVVSFGRLVRGSALDALRTLYERRLGENERDALSYGMLLDDLKRGSLHVREIDDESTAGADLRSDCGGVREPRSLSADENVTETDAIAIVADVVVGSSIMVGC